MADKKKPTTECGVCGKAVTFKRTGRLHHRISEDRGTFAVEEVTLTKHAGCDNRSAVV